MTLKGINQVLKILHVILFQMVSLMLFLCQLLFLYHWQKSIGAIVKVTNQWKKYTPVENISLILENKFSLNVLLSGKQLKINPLATYDHDKNRHNELLVIKLFKLSFMNQNVWLLPTRVTFEIIFEDIFVWKCCFGLCFTWVPLINPSFFTA